MSEQWQAHRVAVRCVGAPPADRVRRAAGVSDVEVDGPVLRCRILGSFQPFLEALHGCEVLDLTSTAASDGRPRPTDGVDQQPEEER